MSNCNFAFNGRVSVQMALSWDPWRERTLTTGPVQKGGVVEKEYYSQGGFSPNLNSRIRFAQGSFGDKRVAEERETEEVARRNGVGPLNPDHWKVIDFVRKYYQAPGNGPKAYKKYKPPGFRPHPSST